MSVIDRIKRGTTSEEDVREIELINRQWGISGFIVGMLVTIVIIVAGILIGL